MRKQYQKHNKTQIADIHNAKYNALSDYTTHKMSRKSDTKATAEVEDVKGDNMSDISEGSDYLPPYPGVIEKPALQAYEIKYKDWKLTRGHVLNPDTQEILYNIEQPSFTRTHVKLKSANMDTEIASGLPYGVRKHIKTLVRGQDLNMRYKSAWKCNYTYNSRAFNGEQMYWSYESGLSSMKYILQDRDGNPIARWIVAGRKVGPFKNLGKLEFFDTNAMSDAAKEEILITGLNALNIEVMIRSQGTIGTSAISTMIAVAAGGKSKGKAPLADATADETIR